MLADRKPGARTIIWPPVSGGVFLFPTATTPIAGAHAASLEIRAREVDGLSLPPDRRFAVSGVCCADENRRPDSTRKRSGFRKNMRIFRKQRDGCQDRKVRGE